MLIGNGPTDLHRVSMVGNDLELDTGIGTCGKNGQGVPVGVGQPTLRMDRISRRRHGVIPELMPKPLCFLLFSFLPLMRPLLILPMEARLMIE